MTRLSFSSNKSFNYTSDNKEVLFGNETEKLFIKAYNELVKYIFRHIYFRVNEVNLAEDLTSETFLKAWKYISRGKQVQNMKGFIYQVANNLVVDYYRAKNTAPLSLDAMKSYADPRENDAGQKVDNDSSMEEVLKVLEILPDAARRIILYRYIDELSIEEIRRITGKSRINIYVTLHRGLKALKNKLKQYD